ncbi:MAG: redoxin domain-containing protein [Phycisphaerales bacterium]|nr:redoxin domain-containing protein [Phycisphaerales bacterium]
MTAKTLLSMFAAGTIALALATGSYAQPADNHDHKPGEKTDHKHDDKKKDTKDAKKVASGAAVGSMAPDFELKDTDGKAVKLSDLTKQGKIVVLEWFNPDCPVVVGHYGSTKTFNDIAKNYKDKNVVLLAINSGAPGKQGSGQERNAKAKKDWGMDHPILLDEKGDVGRAYGSKNTPTMYVINKDGILAYRGAIDDGGSGDGAGKTNYVTKALDEIIAGKEVTTKETKAYGCGVKY